MGGGGRFSVLELIDLVLDVGGPFEWSLRFVEGLPGNGFTDFHDEGFVAVAKHFVDQIEHGDVKLDAEGLADVGQTVETVGVAAAEVDGHDVTLRLHALGDESLVPGQVTNDATTPPRAQSGGKHNDVIVTFEAGLDHLWKTTALCAHFVDGDAERRQPVEVHQEVVDEIFHPAVVVFAENGSQCHAVLTAQRVVAHKSETSAVCVGGQIFKTFDFEFHIEKFHAVFEPGHSLFVAFALKKRVDFVLMNDTLEPIDDKAGHTALFAACLATHNGFDVYLEDFVAVHLFVEAERSALYSCSI